MKGDIAETENSLAGDEASSERQERQKSRADAPRSRLLQRRLPQFVCGCCVEAATSLATGSEERQKCRADQLVGELLLGRSSPQSMRRFLWACDSTDGCAQDVAGLRKHRRQHGWTCPRPHGNAVGCFFLNSLMSSLFLSFRHRNPDGM